MLLYCSYSFDLLSSALLCLYYLFPFYPLWLLPADIFLGLTANFASVFFGATIFLFIVFSWSLLYHDLCSSSFLTAATTLLSTNFSPFSTCPVASLLVFSITALDIFSISSYSCCVGCQVLLTHQPLDEIITEYLTFWRFSVSGTSCWPWWCSHW